MLYKSESFSVDISELMLVTWAGPEIKLLFKNGSIYSISSKSWTSSLIRKEYDLLVNFWERNKK